MQIEPKDRIIVSLDVPSPTLAAQIITELPDATTFKLGHHLIMAENFMLDLLSRDFRDGFSDEIRPVTNFFFDFKYFDIPRTVEAGIRGLRQHENITMCTVHAATSVMQAAVTAAGDHLKVLAVSLLTSFDDEELLEFYGDLESVAFIEHRMQRAVACGCHGAICPPDMVSLVRDQVPSDFLIVVPGIRLEGTGHDDHKHSGTPRQVIADGADYLVIGKPLVEADDPKAIFAKIVEEISSPFF